jgi:hypothetical protein
MIETRRFQATEFSLYGMNIRARKGVRERVYLGVSPVQAEQ